MKQITTLTVCEEPGGEQFVQATYSPHACGCRVVGGGTLQQPLRVRMCALHDAAPGLLTMLGEAESLMPLGTAKRADWVIRAATLRAKAEGRS